MMTEDIWRDVALAPTKIIAVHVNYPSRAAQRGRTPELPSYFLKPTTSVAASGSTVERPAGCELLAFEGEIALVMGARIRRARLEDAWAAVGFVTAANDFGVYDLRYADKGSNLRSKGADGFTPLGPRMLSAREVDPTALRIRTWVNGELVQEDTTADLLFPFARLVADLSQLITLEIGDVILTGTPAGASVVQPGDVVEVEVDGTGIGGKKLSTARLTSTITQGTVPLTDVGALPRVDDQQRADAYGVGLAPVVVPVVVPVVEPVETVETVETPLAGDHRFELTADLKAKINSVGTATLSSQLRKHGFNNMSIDGLSSTKPGMRLVGLARTLRFVPNREDLFAAHGGGYNAQKQAFDALNPDDVLVMDCRQDTGAGTLGDVLGLRAQVRGAAGIVTDGGLRDVAAVTALDIPTYFGGPHPAVLGRKHVPWDIDQTVACGGATVQPGDVIVGDDDGLLVIPPSMIEEIVDAAIEQERQETFIAQQVGLGEKVDGLYPMNDGWKQKYREWDGR
jgi:2-keto-4-pentenoate hydratase/2-oxohepta-3-ene-1,7-dioic acid hydratase in catechol pathway/regulator of RNase E activity RraA